MKQEQTLQEKGQIYIIISGFGWSGSGVLVDILREHPEVRVAGGDELIFFWLFDTLVEKARNRKNIELSGENESLFCAKIPQTFNQEKQEQYETTFNAYFNDESEKRFRYSEVAQSVLSALILQSQRPENTFFDEKLVGSLAGKLLKTFSDLMQPDSSKLYIYDNLIHPQQLSVLRHLDTSFSEVWIYCIDRDARDQFFEQYERYATGLGQWHTLKGRQRILTAFAKSGLFRALLRTSLVKMLAAIIFVRMHSKKREAFRQAIEHLEGQANIKIIPLKFESLVLNEEGQREQLLETILQTKSFTSREIERGKYFVAGESSKNIGKYQKIHSKKMYSYIERKLYEYCHYTVDDLSRLKK